MEFSKDLIAASSTPLVLAILSEGDSYGYAIIKRVQELSGGRMEWTDGMLYPVLHRLERLGYIKARWEESETGRRRKYYRITSQGKTQLAEERKQWQAVDATLKGIWKIVLMEKSEISNTKSETNPNDLNPKSILQCVLNLPHLDLEFVSEFVLRMSCFPKVTWQYR